MDSLIRFICSCPCTSQLLCNFTLFCLTYSSNPLHFCYWQTFSRRTPFFSIPIYFFSCLFLISIFSYILSGYFFTSRFILFLKSYRFSPCFYPLLVSFNTIYVCVLMFKPKILFFCISAVISSSIVTISFTPGTILLNSISSFLKLLHIFFPLCYTFALMLLSPSSSSVSYVPPYYCCFSAVFHCFISLFFYFFFPHFHLNFFSLSPFLKIIIFGLLIFLLLVAPSS